MQNRCKTNYQVIILALLFFSFILAGVQKNQGVLAPENANEARLNRLQPPAEVMDAIGVQKGMRVAEIGAGHGRYIVQLAVRVGEKGKVYAEDIDNDALEHCQKRCRKWGLKQVEIIQGKETDPQLPPGELDLIFIISAYHHFKDPVELLKNARSSLKSNGILAIAEWMPRDDRRNSFSAPARIKAQMKNAGYQFQRIDYLLKKSNMLIYIFQPQRL